MRPGTPEAAASEQVWPDAPKAAAHEASASTPEVGIRCPVTKGHAPTLGSLRLDLEALRKRKGLPSCSGDAYRLLKQRKYIAVDE